jgi:hypothetical protein
MNQLSMVLRIVVLDTKLNMLQQNNKYQTICLVETFYLESLKMFDFNNSFKSCKA